MQGIELNLNHIGTKGDIALIKIKGYLDTTTSSEVSSRLGEILKQGTYQLIIDMGGVNYVSSAGWGIFVGEIRNIRENCGDLKIVQMTPDVFEVFEMLEFNRILDYYETIEEAVNDFDISIGMDITKGMQWHQMDKTPEGVAISIPSPRMIAKSSVPKSERKAKSRFAFTKPKIVEATLPLVEKIKLLVIENPNHGVRQIKKNLHTQRFGYEKAGYFKIRDILKKYNLDTREKRYRFYRSR